MRHGGPDGPAEAGTVPRGMRGLFHGLQHDGPAALGETEDVPDSFTVGEVSLHPGKRNAASQCLRNQAEMMMAPWTAGRFLFQGV